MQGKRKSLTRSESYGALTSLPWHKRINVPSSHVYDFAAMPGVELVRFDKNRAELAVTIDALAAIKKQASTVEQHTLSDGVAGSMARPYQRDGANWILDRWAKCGYAYLAFDLRLGKTLTSISALESIGLEHVLIVPPAGVVRTWVTELLRWTDRGSIIVLDGRGAKQLRIFRTEDGKTSKNGRLVKTSILREKKGKIECPRCGQVGDRVDVECHACNRQIRKIVSTARFVICPYDRLVPQVTRNECGAELERRDLPGWARLLGQQYWDLVVADEAVKLRTWSTKPGARDRHRRTQIIIASQNTDRKLAICGTPSFGRFRHLWGQLDWLSDGCYGRSRGRDSRGGYTGPFERTPFLWDRRYCNGRKVEIESRGISVWVADGESPLVKTEWAKWRRPEIMLIKRRSDPDIAAQLPPLDRQTRWIEGASKIPPKRGKNRVDVALRRSLEAKLEAMVDEIVEELTTGAKVLVLASRHASVDTIAAALRKIAEGRGEEGAALRAQSYRQWIGRGLDRSGGGVNAEARALIVEELVRHDGAGCLITTTHSLADGGISMRGVSSVHHAEYHDSPIAMVQAELRGYEPGISTGYSITHWHSVGSIDDHIRERVMPQIELVVNAMADPTVSSMGSALTRSIEKIDYEDILSAWAKNVELDDDE